MSSIVSSPTPLEMAGNMRVLVFCENKIESGYAAQLEKCLGESVDISICGPVVGPPVFAWEANNGDGRSLLREAIIAIKYWSSMVVVHFRQSRSLWGRSVNWTAQTIYCLPLRTIFRLRRLRRYIKGATRMIEAVEPDLVVLFEDNIENLTQPVAIAAARANIPYIVLPTSIPNPREPASFYRNSLAHSASGPLRGWLAKRWPNWVYEFEGKPMFRLPVPDILALRFCDVHPRTPWILNVGNAAAICIESEALKEVYLELGAPESQLAVTGSPIDDCLAEVSRYRAERRHALLTGLGLDASLPLVLVAFPPDQYTSPNISTFEYQSFSELVDGWADALGPVTSKCSVIVRPHPRLDSKHLKPLERAGCRVVDVPTQDLVPLADVYVACISATIRWALALGIPVINYDCYRYRYKDFATAVGLVAMEDHRNFAAAVEMLCSDARRRADLTENQKADASRWGLIDGCFGQRVLEVMRRAVMRNDDVGRASARAA